MGNRNHFKYFAAECPPEFVDSLWVVSKANFELDADQETNESEGWESLFDGTSQKKMVNQMAQNKDHFLQRITDFLEILIEFKVWVKLYLAVLNGLKRLGSLKPAKPEIFKRLVNVLTKFQKIQVLPKMECAR